MTLFTKSNRLRNTVMEEEAIVLHSSHKIPMKKMAAFAEMNTIEYNYDLISAYINYRLLVAYILIDSYFPSN